MKRAAAVLFAAGLLALGLWFAGVFDAAEAAEAGGAGTVAVARGDLAVTLTERGTLKARNSTQIRAETHAKIEWLVDEGVSVKKGDVLVRFDRTELERQVEQLENQVTQLESEHKSASVEEVIQVDQNKTNVEKAELALEVAKVTLEKLLQGDIPQKERQLRLAIEKAESEVKRAEENVRAAKQLLEEDFITAAEYEQEELFLDQKRTELESARLEMELYEKYERPIEIKKKQAEVVEAERGLERAKVKAEAELAAKRAHVKQKEIALNAARDRLKREQEKLDKMTLTAPTDGNVLYGDPDQPWYLGNIKVGGQVWNNMTIITLPDPTEMSVVIQVHEADIAKVQQGMKAFVTSEMRKGEAFEGEVAKIDSVANAGQRGSGDDVKRFKVEIHLSGQKLDLKPGTSARVELQIGLLEDVLHVPVQAVHAREGEFFCYVRGAGAATRRAVTPGRSNQVYVEITEGLEEGEEVLLYDPDVREEGKPAASGPAGAESS